MRVSKNGVKRGPRGGRRLGRTLGSDLLRLGRMAGLAVTDGKRIMPLAGDSLTAKACRHSLVSGARENTQDHNISRMSRESTEALKTAEFQASVIIVDTLPEK